MLLRSYHMEASGREEQPRRAVGNDTHLARHYLRVVGCATAPKGCAWPGETPHHPAATQQDTRQSAVGALEDTRVTGHLHQRVTHHVCTALAQSCWRRPGVRRDRPRPAPRPHRLLPRLLHGARPSSTRPVCNAAADIHKRPDLSSQ